jgi:hypothetical protein
MARIMPALEFRSFHSHRSCENVPKTTRLATLSGRAGSCAELDEPVGDRELVRWVEVLKRLTFDGVVRHTKHVAQLLWIDGQPSRAAYCRILLLLRLKPNRTWSSHRRVHPTEESPAPLVVILRTNLSQFTVSTLVCHHRPSYTRPLNRLVLGLGCLRRRAPRLWFRTFSYT